MTSEGEKRLLLNQIQFLQEQVAELKKDKERLQKAEDRLLEEKSEIRVEANALKGTVGTLQKEKESTTNTAYVAATEEVVKLSHRLNEQGVELQETKAQLATVTKDRDAAVKAVSKATTDLKRFQEESRESSQKFIDEAQAKLEMCQAEYNELKLAYERVQERADIYAEIVNGTRGTFLTGNPAAQASTLLPATPVSAAVAAPAPTAPVAGPASTAPVAAPASTAPVAAPTSTAPVAATASTAPVARARAATKVKLEGALANPWLSFMNINGVLTQEAVQRDTVPENNLFQYCEGKAGRCLGECLDWCKLPNKNGSPKAGEVVDTRIESNLTKTAKTEWLIRHGAVCLQPCFKVRQQDDGHIEPKENSSTDMFRGDWDQVARLLHDAVWPKEIGVELLNWPKDKKVFPVQPGDRWFTEVNKDTEAKELSQYNSHYATNAYCRQRKQGNKQDYCKKKLSLEYPYRLYAHGGQVRVLEDLWDICWAVAGHLNVKSSVPTCTDKNRLSLLSWITNAFNRRWRDLYDRRHPGPRLNPESKEWEVLLIDETALKTIAKFGKGKDSRNKHWWFVTLTRVKISRDANGEERFETLETAWHLVQNRDAATLENIIKQYTKADGSSVVYTDGWKGYAQLKNKGICAFHYVINHKTDHSVDFYDDVTNSIKKIHINNAESGHKTVKRAILNCFHHCGNDNQLQGVVSMLTQTCVGTEFGGGKEKRLTRFKLIVKTLIQYRDEMVSDAVRWDKRRLDPASRISKKQRSEEKVTDEDVRDRQVQTQFHPDEWLAGREFDVQSMMKNDPDFRAWLNNGRETVFEDTEAPNESKDTAAKERSGTKRNRNDDGGDGSGDGSGASGGYTVEGNERLVTEVKNILEPFEIDTHLWEQQGWIPDVEWERVPPEAALVKPSAIGLALELFVKLSCDASITTVILELMMVMDSKIVEISSSATTGGAEHEPNNARVDSAGLPFPDPRCCIAYLDDNTPVPIPLFRHADKAYALNSGGSRKTEGGTILQFWKRMIKEGPIFIIFRSEQYSCGDHITLVAILGPEVEQHQLHHIWTTKQQAPEQLRVKCFDSLDYGARCAKNSKLQTLLSAWLNSVLQSSHNPKDVKKVVEPACTSPNRFITQCGSDCFITTALTLASLLRGKEVVGRILGYEWKGAATITYESSDNLRERVFAVYLDYLCQFRNQCMGDYLPSSIQRNNTAPGRHPMDFRSPGGRQQLSSAPAPKTVQDISHFVAATIRARRTSLNDGDDKELERLRSLFGEEDELALHCLLQKNAQNQRRAASTFAQHEPSKSKAREGDEVPNKDPKDDQQLNNRHRVVEVVDDDTLIPVDSAPTGPLVLGATPTVVID